MTCYFYLSLCTKFCGLIEPTKTTKFSIQRIKQNFYHIFTGAAYARAEKAVRDLVEGCKLPFLPTPMGKGVIPDDHPLCVAPARSKYVGNFEILFADGILNFIYRWNIKFYLQMEYKILFTDGILMCL